jgi:hypothetical protein
MGDSPAMTLELDYRRDRFVTNEECAAIWGEPLVKFSMEPPEPR